MPSRRRILLAALVAAAVCLVLSSRVFVSFDALRVKLVRTPVAATGGSITVGTAHDARAARLDAPVAVIAVLRNDAEAAHRFALLADDHAVCDVELARRSTRRVDCVIDGGWIRGPAHTLVIKSDAPAWSLEFLEIATHHGSSSRLVAFYILPDRTASFTMASWPWVAATGLAVWLLVLVPLARWPAGLLRLHAVVTAGLAVLLGAMLISPWASRYQLMLPVAAFVQVGVLLFAPQLWRVGAAGVRTVGRVPWAEWLARPGVAVAAVALIVTGVFALVVRNSVHEFDGNYTGLIRISEEGFDQSPLVGGRDDVRATLALLPNEGYDSQFMYFTTFDPLLRRFHDDPHQYRYVVDAPPYRFGRIGMPWLVRAVAGDRWAWYPYVMIGLVLGGVAISAAVVARMAQQAGMSALWGLVVLAIPGFWQSVRVVLPEPVAAATLVLGYWCAVRRRYVAAAACLALSLLVRETGLVLVAALVVLLPAAMATWRNRLVLAAAVLPLVAWRLYLAWVLWPDYGSEALLYSSDNLSLPLAGIAGLWQAVSAGAYHPHVPELSRAAAAFPLVLALMTLVFVGLRRHLDRYLGVALAAYVLMALSLTFPKVWGHVGNAQRTSYEAFILMAVATVSAPAMTGAQRRLVIASWVACAAFVLYGAHDALNTREALFPW